MASLISSLPYSEREGKHDLGTAILQLPDNGPFETEWPLLDPADVVRCLWLHTYFHSHKSHRLWCVSSKLGTPTTPIKDHILCHDFPPSSFSSGERLR